MRLTIREIHLFADGQNERAKEMWRQEIAKMHMLACLIRYPQGKRLPSLDRLMPRDAPKLTKEQRTEHIRDMMFMLSRPGEIA